MQGTVIRAAAAAVVVTIFFFLNSYESYFTVTTFECNFPCYMIMAVLLF
jgi:hypothetical protein